jgi:hypothetical protein
MADGNVSIYQPRMMLAALKQVAIPKRFFHNTFFGTTLLHNTKTVELDVRKGKRRVAVYVNPILKGKVVERDPFETKETRPAYVKEMTALRSQDTTERVIGENIYDALDPARRAAQILGEDLAMLDERLTRLEEKMCAEALLTGKVIVKGDGWNDQVDFGYEMDKHIRVLSGTAKWDDENADPMKDLDEWRLDIMKRCGISPDVCVIGNDVYWAILNNAKVKERLDNNRIRLGIITAESQPEGISYCGDLLLPTGPVSLYTYNEWSTNPITGEDEPLMPNNKVLLGSTRARATFNYGLIQNLKALRPLPRFPWSWEEDDGSARFVQLESAPMPNLYQVDAFTVATVL